MTVDPGVETQLRQAFKYLNKFMLMMWRLGLGSWLNFWPSVGGRIMVLSHIGRKSGLKHHTPVNYTILNGDIFCVAGFGNIADWYRNIINNPEVEVWLPPNSWWEGVGKDISESQDRLPILRQVLIASGFAARAFGINPYTISDENLEELCKEYRLLRISRKAPLTGTGGPGDQAWVWPRAVAILLPFTIFLVLRKNKK